MKRVLAFALLGVFFASVASAQDQRQLVQEFTRATYFGGTKLNFMLLTDKTIDLLFKGASKDTVKAKTDGGTAFYISGTADKNAKLDTKFIAIQDEEKTPGTVVLNLQNFVDGELPKGSKISGIVQFEKKLNLNKFFSIKNSDAVLDFKFSDIALRSLPD